MKNDNCIWFNEVCNLYNTENCSKNCIRYMEMKILCKYSNIPKNYQTLKLFNTSDIEEYVRLEEIKNDIKNWVSAGSNVYIYSSITGNGKTSWAINLMLSYFRVIWSGNGFNCRGVYLPIGELIKAYRGKFEGNIVGLDEDTIINCDLVIFDDIGISTLTAFEHQIIMSFIDKRLALGKSNIYTSNVDFKDLQVAVGNRLASRIWHTSEHIEFLEKDLRCRK